MQVAEPIAERFDEFLDVISFPVFSIHLGFKIRLEYLIWFNFGDIIGAIGHFYDNDLLPAEFD